MTVTVDSYLSSLVGVLRDLPQEPLEELASCLVRAWRRDAQVFLLGNGGSAATASHLACDWSKGTTVEGRRRLRVVPLVDNAPLITAWANDSSYEDVFAQQLLTLARPGDVVVAFSGSGNSPNVLRAVEIASQVGATTVGITGQGGALAAKVDVAVVVPTSCMQRIEDVHLAIGHAVGMALRHLMAQEPLPAPAVFVDRDGVINALEPGKRYVTSWEEFHFIPRALEALAALCRMGARVVVVTNQSCIGRGLVSRRTVRLIHASMEEAVERAGGRIEAVYVCPHQPEDGCGCRKPRPGLFYAAQQDLGIDLARSVVIGDDSTDMEAARRIGARGVLVRTGHGRDCAHQGVVVEDLWGAVQWIEEHGAWHGSSGGTHEEQGPSLH